VVRAGIDVCDNQGLGSSLMIEESGGLGADCHRRILAAASALLANAQRSGPRPAGTTPISRTGYSHSCSTRPDRVAPQRSSTPLLRGE
jgi:hypothetical protein